MHAVPRLASSVKLGVRLALVSTLRVGGYNIKRECNFVAWSRRPAPFPFSVKADKYTVV